MKRTYGPAGDDASRERWEQKMDDASVEIAERAHQFADPDEAAFRALRSRALERADTSPLEAMLDQEIANMREHSSEAQHRQDIHEANATTGNRRMTRPVVRRPT